MSRIPTQDPYPHEQIKCCICGAMSYPGVCGSCGKINSLAFAQELEAGTSTPTVKRVMEKFETALRARRALEDVIKGPIVVRCMLCGEAMIYKIADNGDLLFNHDKCREAKSSGRNEPGRGEMSV